MRGNTATTNNMAKKKGLYAEGEKPMTFRQAILLAANTPRLTHKQIDELRKQGKLDALLNKSNNNENIKRN